MRVVIAGSSGLIGTALRQSLELRGDQVISLVRHHPKSKLERWWSPSNGKIDPQALKGADAVVNLAGAGIADSRWTPQYRRQLVSSRLTSTKTLVKAMPTGTRFVSASAVGFYGAHCGDEVLTEESPAGAGFLAQLCVEWEAAANVAPNTVTLRTGNVLTNRGGFLGKQRLLYKLGLGGPIGNGQQWLSWITLADHVRAMVWAIEGTHRGPVNLVAPGPVRNRDFAKGYAAGLHRPALVPFPRLPAAIVLGREMIDQTISAVQRAIPRVLTEGNFEFAHPQLPEALQWLGSE